MWFLCLSPECRELLDRLQDERIQTVSLEDLEVADVDLIKVKPSRSRAEYIFTLTASWMNFLFESRAEIDLLTYLDADLYFFGDFEEVFRELGDASIGIIEHRHARVDSDRLKYGRFNVGWVSIRQDNSGLKCVRRWREQCIQWCYDRAENGKFADQKYLDEWPESYNGVQIITHPGVNLAPWNLGRHSIAGTRSVPTADNRPVIFYHFTNMWRRLPRYVWTGLGDYEIPTDACRNAVRLLYKPYLKAVEQATMRLSSVGYSDVAFNYSRHDNPGSPSHKVSTLRERIEVWRKIASQRKRGEILFFPE